MCHRTKKNPKTSNAPADFQKNETIIEGYDYLGNSCSATDCTGLIPSAPASQAEQEAYEEVYHYQPKAVKNQDRKKEPSA